MNKEKVIFFILFTFIIATHSFAQKIHWASQVQAFSSEYENRLLGKEGKAIHVLGKPSKYPEMDSTNSAWRPYGPNATEEYIIVNFDTLMPIRQIAVFENFNAGALFEVYGLDLSNNLHLLKRLNSGYNSLKSQVTNIILDKKTDYPINGIKLVFAPRRLKEAVFQIDAIGISDSTSLIQETLKLPSDNNSKFYRERLDNDINSPTPELAPIVSPDDKILYFTRWRHPKNIGSQKNQDIWYSLRDLQGNWGKPELFPPPLNNEYDNSICAITSDGKTLLVNNVYQTDGTMKIGVSRSFRLRTGAWGIPQEVKIPGFHNKSKFAEYAISPDGKIIIFSAEMNDSYGGKDLYISFEKGDNSWSAPKNLGPKINSGEDESTPFIAPDGITLYFSSAGKIGYGDNDIYLTRRLSSTWDYWSEPENLGPIVNTAYWDGYFSLSAKGDYAYFSSGLNSVGKEDIFRLRLPEKIKPQVLVNFKANFLNDSTKSPISAQVLVRSVDKLDTMSFNYDPYNGPISFMWPVKKPFEIIAFNKNYFPQKKYYNFSQNKEYKEILEEIPMMELVLNKKFQLPEINFDQGSSELLPAAYPQLDEVLRILKDFPTLNILIEGHTDNQGDWYQNMKLSEDRVKSVASFLVSKGINPIRLKTKGWGSNKPIGNNSTEALRKMNRRVEFSLIAP